MIFLSDYDLLMAEHLVQGVDVWVNTPRRPWEASGTSGMKVLVNGGLNLSELDGWWAEAYSPEVGWAIGDGREHGDDPAWDAAEADALYGLLEREIVPEFYSRDEHGIPRAWVARMRESMAQLTPVFSTNRVVRQYTEEHYLLAAAAFAEGVEFVAGDAERLGDALGALELGRVLVVLPVVLRLIGLPTNGSFGTRRPHRDHAHHLDAARDRRRRPRPPATSAVAMLVACCDEPHCVLTVVAAASSGRPACSHAVRVTLAACIPT